MLLRFPSTSAVSSYKLEKQNALEDVVPQKLELLTMIVSKYSYHFDTMLYS